MLIRKSSFSKIFSFAKFEYLHQTLCVGFTLPSRTIIFVFSLITLHPYSFAAFVPRKLHFSNEH